jgi:DNA-directed RNA polymerase specialized sigma24 family protein
MANKHYVDTIDLEEWWMGWIVTGDEYAWDQLANMIYKMCFGISCHFNPSSEEEHQDYSHETFLQTMEKIKLGKLKFIPGKAPVFNLLTTTIMRQLYSKMNKEKRRKTHMFKYAEKVLVAKNPEDMKEVLDYIGGHGGRHVSSV